MKKRDQAIKTYDDEIVRPLKYIASVYGHYMKNDSDKLYEVIKKLEKICFDIQQAYKDGYSDGLNYGRKSKECGASPSNKSTNHKKLYYQNQLDDPNSKC